MQGRGSKTGEPHYGSHAWPSMCSAIITLSLIHISVTDNPTIFPDEDRIISGGNFHGQPLAISYDFLGIALAELGTYK